MPKETERIPPDLKLLGEIIVALNISCRNAGIYPKDHPAVDISLRRAFELFQKMFESRQGFTIAVGKDTLLIDNYSLDRRNPSYSQFAGLLKKLNIAYVTFLRGFTKEELYVFQHFVSKQLQDLSHDDLHEVLNSQSLAHIQIGFADYSSFFPEEGKTSPKIVQEDIWEIYIMGLISGTLKKEDLDEIEKIPADIFSEIINKMHKNYFDKAATKTFLNAYIQKLFQQSFSDYDIKKLVSFISGLEPDLREQFMALVVNTLSQNIPLAAKSLNRASPDLIITLFETIKAQKISIPDNLRNLLDKLMGLAREASDPLSLRDSSFVDDISLPSDMFDILAKSELERTIFDPFETSTSDEYQRDLRKLADFDTSGKFSVSVASLRRDCDDDYIDRCYHYVIFELMASDIVSEEEYLQFINSLRKATSQFMLTGEYGNIVHIIKLLRLNLEKNKFPDITSEALNNYYKEEFFSEFVDSLRLIGRQARDEAIKFCELYGEMIIPSLITALTNEASKAFRSLLMGLLKQFGEKIIPYAIKGLDDSRWFVKRNMLFFLTAAKDKGIIPHVRPYCQYKNEKVRLEAIKCLLNLQDYYVVDVLKRLLSSEAQEDVEQAIALIGSFKVKDMSPDLIKILRGQGTIKADLEMKLSLIRAMGSIADIRCLEAFREILSSKSFFFGRDLKKMKEEVYKTLQNFSFEDMEDYVREGLKSKNKVISEECSRLSKMRGR